MPLRYCVSGFLRRERDRRHRFRAERAGPGRPANLSATAGRFLSSRAADYGTSIDKLGERGSLVQSDMVGLGALDLVLRNVRARMMSIAAVIEVAGMHAEDRAADAPRLGIPAHAIMDLEALRHGYSIRCRRKTAKAGSSRTEYSSGMRIPTDAPAIGSSKSQHFADNQRF
jgi:hypothetical protein